MKKEYELLSKIEYENNTYLIFIQDRKKIIFAKEIDDIITIDLSKEEYKLLNKIYNNLKINTSNSIKLENMTINNNTYEVYYDPFTKNHFWKDLNIIEDNIFLNFRYNNMPTTYYNETKEEKKNSKFYKKVIKIGHKLIPILISATISLSVLTGCNLIDRQQKEIDNIQKFSYVETIKKENNVEESINIQTYEKELETEEVKKEYNYEEIKNAINNNPNLTKEEKKFLESLKFIFDENNQYMDLEIIIDRLDNLKIEYKKEEKEAANRTIGGYYDSEENILTMENTESFKDADLRIFLHEFLHVLQINPYRYLAELSNEAFTRETIRRMIDEGLLEKEKFQDYTTKAEIYGLSYSKDLFVYLAITELLDENTLREYQFSCEDETITNALSDKSNTYRLLNSIDKLRSYDLGSNLLVTNDNNINRHIMLDSLNYFYEEKKGKKVEEDLELVCQSKYVDDICTEALEQTMLDYINENYDKEDMYFGERRVPSHKSYLSNNYNKVKLTFDIKKYDFISLEITEELCSKYQENYNYLLNLSQQMGK